MLLHQEQLCDWHKDMEEAAAVALLCHPLRSALDPKAALTSFQ